MSIEDLRKQYNTTTTELTNVTAKLTNATAELTVFKKEFDEMTIKLAALQTISSRLCDQQKELTTKHKAQGRYLDKIDNEARMIEHSKKMHEYADICRQYLAATEELESCDSFETQLDTEIIRQAHMHRFNYLLNHEYEVSSVGNLETYNDIYLLADVTSCDGKEMCCHKRYCDSYIDKDTYVDCLKFGKGFTIHTSTLNDVVRGGRL